MAMVCPQCGTTYEQHMQCTACNIRLFRQGEAGPAPVAETVSWQQTAWGRIVLGLVLAQGLYWGLRHLTMAAVIGVGGEETGAIWLALLGFFLLQGLLAISVSLGTVLAGAGQKLGYGYGVAIGFLSAATCLVFEGVPDPAAEIAFVYGAPIVQAVLGGLMGWVGGLIWQPLPQVVTPGDVLRRPVNPTQTTTFLRRGYLSGPIAWWRVAIGSGVAVAGTLMAGTCLEFLESTGGRVETYSKQSLLMGEIIALALLLGGAIAGSATLNGIKQGLVGGLLTAGLLTGILIGQNKATIDFILLTDLSAVVLGVIGGGFGSQLIPPLVRRRPLSVAAMDPPLN